jgi:hypothetical protein
MSDHARITTPEGSFHVKCHGEQERRIGAARFKEGISRKDVRRSLKELKKCILRDQVCEYFPHNEPTTSYCIAGGQLPMLFKCTKTFALACDCHKMQKDDEANGKGGE